MLKRALFFSQPYQLSLRNSQLVISVKEAPGEQRTIPIEDIGYVILEDPQISVTLPLLNALSDNNAAVIFCGADRMPNAMLQNLDSNATQGEHYREQIAATDALKRRLWKQIVEAKICNQSRLLSKLGKSGDLLKPYYKNVKSGDVDNREGVASKIYWTELFGYSFIRSRKGSAPNDLLNYGYTVLRAGMARALMGSGLFPAFGIFHRNRYNAFPLADDMMEPYRPYVDEIVYALFMEGETILTKSVKAKLIGLLYQDVCFPKRMHPLEVGLTMSSASLANCFSGKQTELNFPEL